MTLSKSDRAWIRKALTRCVGESEERVKAHLSDVLAEEARLAVLQAMTANQTPPPTA